MLLILGCPRPVAGRAVRVTGLRAPMRGLRTCGGRPVRGASRAGLQQPPSAVGLRPPMSATAPGRSSARPVAAGKPSATGSGLSLGQGGVCHGSPAEAHRLRAPAFGTVLSPTPRPQTCESQGGAPVRVAHGLTARMGRSISVLVRMRRCRIPSWAVSVRRAVERDLTTGPHAAGEPSRADRTGGRPRAATARRRSNPGAGDTNGPEGPRQRHATSERYGRRGRPYRTREPPAAPLLPAASPYQRVRYSSRVMSPAATSAMSCCFSEAVSCTIESS